MADQKKAFSGRPVSMNGPPYAFRSFAAYHAAYLAPDFVSGLTLAAIAVPEQMATSRLGGFSPQFGFFAFIAGSLAFAVVGSSRFLSSGADSTITPIFAGGLAGLAVAGSSEYVALASMLALLVGVILIAGGLFRLGWIAHLLSVPVTAGFLAGIAAHIGVSQLPSVLGLPPPPGEVPEAIVVLAGQLETANPFTVAIGIGVLGVMLASERVDARIPGALIGLVAATGAVVALGLESRGVAVLGDISGTMPTPLVPSLSRAQWIGLVPLAAIIGMVVMVQTAATTQAFPSEPDRSPDVDRDFIGVGAGSILSGLAGSFPVNASPPRTATVAQTGGRTQLAGLVAAAIVLGLVLAGAAPLRHVPQAALGGVLFFVAYRIVRVRQIAAVYRSSPGEFMLIIATTAAMLAMPIEQGVGVGIALSLLHGVWSTTRARIIDFERIPGTSIWWPQSPHFSGEHEPDMIVVGFPAPLSFLNADAFREGIEEALHRSADKVRLVVVEATGIVEIDYTAAQVLIALIRRCRDDRVGLVLARLESVRAQAALARFGVDDVLGANAVYRSVEEAIRAFRAVERAASPELDQGG